MTKEKGRVLQPRRSGFPWFILVAVVVLGTEALLWVAPVTDPYARLKGSAPASYYIRSAFPPGLALTTDVEAGLPGMKGPNRFTTNAAGYRGPDLVDPKPADEFRIFVVGGSTAEGFYLDDTQALHATLHDALHARFPEQRIRVYNAGKSGDRSDDHVAMVVHRIVHAAPDLVIVFVGINDLLAGILGYDFRHVASSELPPRFGIKHQLRFLATEFQLPRRLFYLAKRLVPPDEQDALQGIPLVSQYGVVTALRKAAPVADSMPPVDTASFDRNLRVLAGALRANRVAVAFVTQQTTWAGNDSIADAWQWMRLRDGRAWRAESLDVALERLNRQTRQVAADFGAPLVDFARILPKSSRYFYDDVHFTVEGARAAGDAIGAVLAGAGLIATRQGQRRRPQRPLRPGSRCKGDPAHSLLHADDINLPVGPAAPRSEGRTVLMDPEE